MEKYIKGLQHIGIPTDNMGATIDFYKMLGFDIIYETINEGNWVVFLELNGVMIETYEFDVPKKDHGAIDHIALDVADIETVYGKVNELGLNTLNDEIHFLPFWENGVRFFNIVGPNRERIEFCQKL